MLKRILESYGIHGRQINCEKINLGHINEVYLIEIKEKISANKFILRKINDTVFPYPKNIIYNYEIIEKEFNTNRSKGHSRIIIPKLCYNIEGHPFSIDESGKLWMMVEYIKNSYSVNNLNDYVAIRNAAASYAYFEKILSNLDINLIKNPLPNFHNWNSRIEKLVKLSQQSEKINNASNEIDYLLDDLNLRTIKNIINKVESLPDRITHNDTKLSNILFHLNTSNPIAIVDLDTVMAGKVVYDFGDMIRSFCNTAAEDEKNLNLVELNEKAFEAISEGYLTEAKSFLTPAEIEMLLPGAKLLIYIQAVRFLTDYLMGNVYYRIAYSDHNLIRTRNQIKLFSSLTEKESVLSDIIKSTYSNLE